MHRCQYNKTWSSQDNIPAGNLNWSQREDNDSDCINTTSSENLVSGLVVTLVVFIISTINFFHCMIRMMRVNLVLNISNRMVEREPEDENTPQQVTRARAGSSRYQFHKPLLCLILQNV